MNIAILGMGNVGSVLGRRWIEAGHYVAFGVRNPAKHQADATKMKAAVADIQEAAAKSEVVVLAVPWPAVPDALKAAGNLSGKVLLDCTNPLKPDLSGLDVGLTTSGGEQVAKAAPGAKVVKIFNTTGAGNMDNPNYGGTKVTVLYAGDDAGAKQIAARLASDLGFDPVNAGPLSSARMLEPFALLWIGLAYQQKMGMDFALNVVRRSEK
jgi:8-hydroxy-5-deazaflavin:NADPH oxidoreductase